MLSFQKFSFRSKVLFLTFFFLASRLFILLTAVETVTQGEELYRGTVAKEMLKGLIYSWSDYHHDSYCGGAFVISSLAAPFFYLFGPSLFSLKLAPLILSLVAFLLVIVMLNRYFGQKAALYGGLLLLFSPTVLSSTSLVGVGNHADSFFISVAMLFFFWEYMRLEKRRGLLAFLLGVSAGFGYWFIPTTASTFIAILITCLWVYPLSRWLRHSPHILFGIFVGSLPFWVRNFSQDFASFEYLQYLFMSGNRAESLMSYVSLKLTKLVKILFLGVPLGMFPGVGSKLFGAVLSAFYFLFIAVAIGSQKESLQKARFFLIFSIVHVIGYTVIAQRFFFDEDAYEGGRILAPLFFFLLIWGAIAISRKKRPFLFLMPLLLLAGIGQASMVFQEPVGRALHYKGYSYADLGEFWGGAQEIVVQDKETFEKVLERLEEPDRRHFFWSYATTKTPSPYYSIEVLRKLPKNYRSYLLEGWGYLLGEEGMGVSDEVQSILGVLSKQEQLYLYRGLAMGVVADGSKTPKSLTSLKNSAHLFWFELGSFLYRPGKELKFQELLTNVDPKLRQWFWKGIGKAAGQRCLNSRYRANSPCAEALKSSLSSVQTSIAWGIGWGWAEFYKEDPLRAWDQLRWLPNEICPVAQQGLEACLAWYQLDLAKD